MAQAGLAGNFVAGANAVPNPMADDGSGVNFGEQNFQPIFEIELLDVLFHDTSKRSFE